jgi:hypothetical protein
MITIEIKHDNQAAGILMAAEKTFKTGSKGYFGVGKIQMGAKPFEVGKIQMGAKRYQVQVQLVEIGSKPKAETE